jgi:hypothetical protein
MKSGFQGYLTPDEFRAEIGTWLSGTDLAIARWDQFDPAAIRWIDAAEIPDGGTLVRYHVLRRTVEKPDWDLIDKTGAGILLLSPRIFDKILTEIFVSIKAENEAQMDLVPAYRVIQRRLRKRATIPTLMKFPGIDELRPIGYKCSEGALEWVRNGGELRSGPKTDPYSVPAPLAPA